MTTLPITQDRTPSQALQALGIGQFVKVSGPEVEFGRQVEGIYGVIVDEASGSVVTEDPRALWVVYLYGDEQDIETFAEDALTWVAREEALT
ncbi:hypothetical protein [Deinococcus sp. Leaf326]|uniref:hypothetical protein n=1 Tax=Deinococcus sp. Leaf326 TaxID=1736338 RepID=UPI00070068D7|nr:hypothetical protein [Deinococcus sp. Leaf326]KQR37785.1 hypothetical protein ASF71_14990 [Deinococcus sp. Leaf326]